LLEEVKQKNNMKKIPLLLPLILLLSLSASAQIEKGTWMLGGSAGLSTSGSDNSGSAKIKNRSFSFGPNVGYFVADKFVLGLKLPISAGRNEVDGSTISSDYRYTSYGFGPNLRYYFPLEEKWSLLAQAGYSFGWQTTKSKYQDGSGIETSSELKNTWNSFNVGGGITYFINKSIGLEGILQYQAYKFDDADYSQNDNIAFTVGLQIYFAK
jgi:opacity protein-like surface antigen